MESQGLLKGGVFLLIHNSEIDDFYQIWEKLRTYETYQFSPRTQALKQQNLHQASYLILLMNVFIKYQAGKEEENR